jgi:chromosome partitioning protein
MRVISIANQKGGCGKTTVAVNLAAALKAADQRVLVFDNDPQGHATLALGVGSGDFTLSARDLYLTSDVKVEDARLEIADGLHLLPADIDLSTVESELAGQKRRTRRLVERFAVSQMSYDYVVIDNPPSVGLLTFNALMASNEAIVPVDAGRFVLESVDRFHRTLQLLEREHGHRVRMHILPANFDLRTRFARLILEQLDQRHPGVRLDTSIHPTVRVREAAAAGLSIDRFDVRSRATMDFALLAIEVQSMQRTADLVSSGELAALLRDPARPAEGVHFAARFPTASQVAVTGDFTDWSVEGIPLARGEDGNWSASVPIAPGCYEYRFIVDGRWVLDRDNPERVKNSYGEVNSVVIVPSGAPAE